MRALFLAFCTSIAAWGQSQPEQIRTHIIDEFERVSIFGKRVILETKKGSKISKKEFDVSKFDKLRPVDYEDAPILQSTSRIDPDKRDLEYTWFKFENGKTEKLFSFKSDLFRGIDLLSLTNGKYLCFAHVINYDMFSSDPISSVCILSKKQDSLVFDKWIDVGLSKPMFSKMNRKIWYRALSTDFCDNPIPFKTEDFIVLPGYWSGKIFIFSRHDGKYVGDISIFDSIGEKELLERRFGLALLLVQPKSGNELVVCSRKESAIWSPTVQLVDRQLLVGNFEKSAELINKNNSENLKRNSEILWWTVDLKTRLVFPAPNPDGFPTKIESQEALNAFKIRLDSKLNLIVEK